MISTVQAIWAAAAAGMSGQEPARDTILVMVAPSGTANVGEWSLLAIAVLAFVGVVALVAFLKRLASHGRRLTEIAGRLEDQSLPVLEGAAGVADNVDAITRSLREEARRLAGSARALSDGLKRASTLMGTRVDEFNALAEFVQSEAEEAVLKTAAAVRGVGAGARALERPRNDAGSVPPAEEPTSPALADDEPAPSLAAPQREAAREPSAPTG